ncbi:deaminase domain-containing protein, partial [Bacillus pseudomycoides]|uniref:deaminase domain-containing protein n=2 Tax=Bacillus pseudomycoides TaxID=64104 RepID=UPI001C54DC1D
FVAEVGSGGLASPIVLPLDAVAIAAGLGAVGHGGFVLNKSIQNAQDTLQKFESSGGRVSETNKVKSFQNRIDNIRNSMPNNTLKKRGNMATADVKIPGLKDKFNAHSKINSKFDKGADVEEFSMLKPESERIFKSYEPSASKPDATKFDKFHDTEAKILEDIASQIKNPNISGKIDLYTELPACQSCSNIILEFRKRYPNIHLNIHTKN